LAASEVVQLDAETHRLEFQVSQLKPGLYLLKINTSAVPKQQESTGCGG
jgi:hypothetical protein